MDFSEDFIGVVSSIDADLSYTNTFSSLLDPGLDQIKRVPLLMMRIAKHQNFTMAVARTPTLTLDARAWTVDGSQYLSNQI